MNLYKGTNLEDALDKAADGENVDIEYLQYRLVSTNETETEIEAYFIADVIEYVKKYIQEIFSNTTIKMEINSKYESEVININLKTDHDAVIIGRKGMSLQALNELVRVAVMNRFDKHYKLLLDIGTYKEDKYNKIIQ